VPLDTQLKGRSIYVDSDFDGKFWYGPTMGHTLELWRFRLMTSYRKRRAARGMRGNGRFDESISRFDEHDAHILRDLEEE